MKKIIPPLMALVVIGLSPSCSSKKQATNNDMPAVNEPQTNMLSDQQKAEGWVLLFDGISMNGWRTFKNQETNSWEVTEGTLHCKSPEDTTASKRADLVTKEQYENFELAFDWKIGPSQNSGVMFRVTEDYDVPYATGPEYQVIDERGYPSPLKDTQMAAANYDMHPASNKTVNAPGEWNSARLIVNGSHVEHWLNGAKVVAYELWSDEWKTMVANSKWKDFPGYGQAKKGHIDLQDHGGEVWFRNIMLKPL
jgi:hypothetical protein